MNAVETILAVYLWTGLLFAIAFLTVGAQRIDPAAKGSTLGFRVLILPATIALWPWLLAKWVRS